MWVKICANTNLADALRAAELGADAVGFVFAPSKRQMTPEQVRRIADALPADVERVGVFGAGPADEIARAARLAGLTAVQLHTEFDAAKTERLEELLPEVSIIQAAHWVVGGEGADGVARQLESIAREAPGRVLVDAKVGGASGGLGVRFDWTEAAGVLGYPRGLWVVLAGGLGPENVAEAIRTVRPWGVDVASGVESEPGRKDWVKMKAFIENARGAV
jgi:phosphoribosylanthranilate isomerase